jgi:myo-inositol-1(or 4)-monophosphatase
MPAKSPLITVMTAAAEKAGRALVRDFGEVEQLQVSRKGPSDFVSTADLKAEKTLKTELSRVRPDFAFLMEEGGQSGKPGATHRWIVDPLDGTLNFLHGLPHWAISIAVETGGEIVAGVIHDPLKNETFWAEKGTGAYMNHRRLRVSGRRDLADAVLATGIPFRGSDGDPAAFSRQLSAVMPLVAGVRRMGSAALDLAYVAAGRYDAYWETGIKCWDVAAGVLLVQESMGRVTELNGGKNAVHGGSILAANDPLYSPLAERLQKA